MSHSLLQAASAIAWSGLWALGGWWIVRFCFNLRRNEELLAGIAAGLILENLAANWIGQFLPVSTAFWVSAALVFLAGAATVMRQGWRSMLALPILPGQWVAFGLLFLISLAITRSLGIFDDYAHLPTTSLIAAGYLPPRFALDPTTPYDYHYFLVLVAAQLMRIFQADSWLALDLARAFSSALALLLTYVWVQRITGSKMAGFLGAALLAFGTGTRWLLLFLPPGLLEKVSAHVTMIGSGLDSGPNLMTAMFGPWLMDGDSAIKFPFAFANGIVEPGVMDLVGANGLIIRALSVLLLLTFNRWRNRWAIPISALFVSAFSLLTEVSILVTLGSWAIVVVGFMLVRKTIRLPKSLWVWVSVIVLGSLIGVLQGGVLHGVMNGLISKVLTGVSVASHETVGFKLAFPPEIVSVHLGVLSLFNPYQAMAALAELGPILLVLPLAAIWGWKSWRAGRWYEAAFVLAGLLTLPTIFVEFTGSTGVRNTERLYNFVDLCLLFAVPLVWLWVAHRADWLKISALVTALVVMLGGVMMFSAELGGISHPIASYFLNSMDVKASHDYWNRLESQTLIFDSVNMRAPTLFGRPTNAAYTWFTTKPEWKALVKNPDAYALRSAGFSYIYLDERYWNGLSLSLQKQLQVPCAVLMREYRDDNSHFRRLIDIRTCQ
jgi:hypothetical protein